MNDKGVGTGAKASVDGAKQSSSALMGERPSKKRDPRDQGGRKHRARSRRVSSNLGQEQLRQSRRGTLKERPLTDERH